MSDWNTNVVTEFRESKGTTNYWGPKLVVLHTIGAKSGELRVQPVVGFEWDGGWQVVASKGGAPENPAWYHNLKAHPSIELEALIHSAAQREQGLAPQVIVRTHSRYLGWTFAQLIAHQGSNGGDVCTGDLVATGTVSGPSDESRACFAEISEMGRRSIKLDGGEWAIDNRWSLKAEYLYVDFGSQGISVLASNTAPYSQTVSVQNAFDVHLARIGLNYRY